jgi:predicted CXXCH cytochrome family protein
VVAYGKGMSEYCANCHPAILQNGYVSGTNMQVHPAGNGAPLGATITANYHAYVKSGDLSATGANYTSLVPFETGVDDTAALKAMWGSTDGRSGAKGAGPIAEATENVSCLSCHRAHASGFESMLRFAHANEFHDDRGRRWPHDVRHEHGRGQDQPRLLGQGRAGDAVLRPRGDGVRPVPAPPMQQVPREGLTPNPHG